MVNTENKNKNKDIFLGIDYGEKNIGLAFGRNGLVKPVKIISDTNLDAALCEINRFVLNNNISKVVVGLPLTHNDKETPQSQKVRKFAKLLKIRLKKPIEFVNEYASTKDSVKTMLGLGISKKRRKSKDHFSAAMVLKNYFHQKGF